jgi:hypothetical protein
MPWQPWFAAARLRTAVGARAAAAERRCTAFRGGAWLAGLDRRAPDSLGLVIAASWFWIDGYIVFLTEGRAACCDDIIFAGKVYNEGAKL